MTGEWQSSVSQLTYGQSDIVIEATEMGGKELAQHFRAVHPNTKALFCSGYTQKAIDCGGESEPGTGFMQKPFTPALLASKVREVPDDHAQQATCVGP